MEQEVFRETTLQLKPIAGSVEPKDLLNAESIQSAFVGELLKVYVIVSYKKSPEERHGKLYDFWKEVFMNVGVVGFLEGHQGKDWAGGVVKPSAIVNSRRGDKSVKESIGPMLLEDGSIAYKLYILVDYFLIDCTSMTLSVEVKSRKMPMEETLYRFKEATDVNSYLKSILGKQLPLEELNSRFQEFYRVLKLDLRVRSLPVIKTSSTIINDRKLVSVHILNCASENIVVTGVELNLSDLKGVLQNQAYPTSPSNVLDRFSIHQCRKTENVILGPKEQESFTFYIDTINSGSEHFKGGSYASYDTHLSVIFSPQRELEWQSISCKCLLKPTDTQIPELSIDVKVDESVQIMKVFQVAYTINNCSDSPKDLSLVLHQPKANYLGSGSSVTSGDAAAFRQAREVQPSTLSSYRKQMASLVCLEKKIDLGNFGGGSSRTISTNFVAFQKGTFELGKARIFDHNSNSYVKAKAPLCFVTVV
eukprot:Nk52_evm23s284 gene=Nk52_evmTU23s284